MITEQQLKEALVRALPEKLGNLSVSRLDHTVVGHYWLDTYQKVTKREWFAIVGMVFSRWLEQNQRDYRHYSYFSPSASWQEMAAHFADIGAITILSEECGGVDRSETPETDALFGGLWTKGTPITDEELHEVTKQFRALERQRDALGAEIRASISLKSL